MVQQRTESRYAGIEGVAGEIFARHAHSQQPESQQLCAALAAILEVVEAQGMQPTPTVLFAAILVSMENFTPDQSAQVTQTCLHNLAVRTESSLLT